MGKGFKFRSRGSVLILTVGVVVLGFLLLISINYLLQYNARQTNAMVWRDRLYHVANEGYTSALAKMSIDPTLGSFNGNETTTTWGVFSSTAMWVSKLPAGTIRDLPEFSESVYVVVSATLTNVNAPDPRNLRLSLVLKLADAGKYYMATKSTLMLAATANSTVGACYGRDIVIYTNPAPPTPAFPRFASLHYFNTATLMDLSQPPSYDPYTLSHHEVRSDFFTQDAPNPAVNGWVNQLPVEPVFPQLGPGNMDRFKSIATSGAHNSYFSGNKKFPEDIATAHPGWANVATGDIFPPGCTDNDCVGLSDDELRNHVYYVDGDLNIRGIVHGQILFVATGKITIDGDLISDSLVGAGMDFNNPDNKYPGCPNPCNQDRALNPKPNASNAHQAVLITPSPDGIYINNNKVPPLPDLNLMDSGVLNLEAFMIMPYGSLDLTRKDVLVPGIDPIPYNFRRAMLMGGSPNFKGFLQQTGANFGYMKSLGFRPPPYIPGFTEVQLWHEEYH